MLPRAANMSRSEKVAGECLTEGARETYSNLELASTKENCTRSIFCLPFLIGVAFFEELSQM